MSTFDLLYQGATKNPEIGIFDEAEIAEEERQRVQKQRSTASERTTTLDYGVGKVEVSEKTSSFLNAIGESNKIIKAIDETAVNALNPNKEVDPNFKMEVEDYQYIAEQNGIPQEFIPNLVSGNKEELEFRTLHYKREGIIDRQINESLSNSMRTGANVLGMVADAEMVAGLGAGMLYKSGSGLAKIAALEGGAEAMVGAAKYYGTDESTLAEVMVDVTIGASVATGAMSLLRAYDVNPNTIKEKSNYGVSESEKWTIHRPDELNILEPTTEGVKEYKRLQNVRAEIQAQIEKGRQTRLAIEKEQKGTEAYITEQKRLVKVRENIRRLMGKGDAEIKALAKQDAKEDTEFMGWYKKKQRAEAEVNKKIEDVEKNFDKEVASAKESQKHYDDLAELRGKAAKYRQELKDKARAKEVKENEAISKAHEEYAKNQELANRFKDSRYEPYKINRREFFHKQNNIDDVIRGNKVKEIDSLKSEVHRAEAKVKELKSNPNTTKRQLTIWENKVKKGHKNLQELTSAKRVDDVSVSVSKQDELILEQIDDMADDILKLKEDMAKYANTNDKKTLESIQSSIKTLPAEVQKQLKEVSDLINSKIKNKDFKKLPIYAKLNKKTRVLIVGGMLVGTGALAGEGEDMSVGGMLVAGIVLIAGGSAAAPMLIRAFNGIGNANIRSSVNGHIERINNSHRAVEFKQSAQGRNLHKTRNLMTDMLHTRFTSTVAPFIKAGGKAKEIMLKLTYSAEYGSGAMELKSRLSAAMFGKYSMAENKLYTAWKNKKGIGFVESIKSRTDLKRQFREEITDHIEGIKVSTDESVLSMSKLIDEPDGLMADFFKANKAHGTFGFEKLNHVKGMIPRLWKPQQLNRLLNQLSDNDVESVRNALANALDRSRSKSNMTESTQRADEFIRSWREEGYNTVKRGDTSDIYSSLSHLLKDDVEIKDLTDAFITKGDTISRAKGRVSLDMKMFQEELNKVKLTSSDIELRISHFVERDIKTILDKTSNTMYASSALSAHGFTSFKALDDAIASGLKHNDPQLMNELQQVADMVKGIPVEITSPVAHNISNMLKDVTIGLKLPLVALSTPTEIIHTLGNMNIFKSSKVLARSVVNSWGADSELVKQLSDITGFGRGTMRMDNTHYGYTDDMIDITDVDVSSKLRIGTMKFRDAVILSSGLSSINDILQRANMVMNAEKLAKHFNGEDAIALSDMKSLNLLDSDKALFKGMFNMNAKGKLKAMDMDKMSVKQKDRLNQLLFNMNQKYAPETTAGETPLYSRNNDFGRMMTTLTSYSLHQFNTHGLQDMRNVNKMTFLHAFGGVAGTWIGLQARMEMQGKEVDDEQLMTYAILNAPQFLGVSAAVGIASPPVVDTMQNVMSIVGAER